MKMMNEKGEAVYFNPIVKHGKDCWVIQGISVKFHLCVAAIVFDPCPIYFANDRISVMVE